MRSMTICARQAVAVMALVIMAWLSAGTAAAQQPDQAAVIREIDAAVGARVDNILGFTDVEHYSVYRGGDESHPVAEMTVRDT